MEPQVCYVVYYTTPKAQPHLYGIFTSKEEAEKIASEHCYLTVMMSKLYI